MSGLYIEKIRDTDRPLAILDVLERAMNDTRRRAFELFQRRGSSPGADLEDWLRAERELYRFSPAELTEDEKQFHLQFAVPGVDPTNLRITALPRAIVVRAEAAHKHDKRPGKMHFCEFGESHLLRRFDFHAPIEVEKVSATLDKGVLEIVAAKSAKAEAQGRQVKVTAIA